FTRRRHFQFTGVADDFEQTALFELLLVDDGSTVAATLKRFSCRQVESGDFRLGVMATLAIIGEDRADLLLKKLLPPSGLPSGLIDKSGYGAISPSQNRWRLRSGQPGEQRECQSNFDQPARG